MGHKELEKETIKVVFNREKVKLSHSVCISNLKLGF